MEWYLMFQPKILCPVLAAHRMLLLFVFSRLSGKGKVADSAPGFFSPPQRKKEGSSIGSLGLKKTPRRKEKCFLLSFWGRGLKSRGKVGEKLQVLLPLLLPSGSLRGNG